MTITNVQTFEVETCCSCGVAFAMESSYRRARLEDHASWCCPNGHRQHYTGKTAAQKLQEQLERERRWRAAADARADQARADAEHHRNRANGMKGQLVRTKNRIAKGVCPCCNRSFVNVERHMASQHPEYGEV